MTQRACNCWGLFNCAPFSSSSCETLASPFVIVWYRLYTPSAASHVLVQAVIAHPEACVVNIPLEKISSFAPVLTTPNTVFQPARGRRAAVGVGAATQCAMSPLVEDCIYTVMTVEWKGGLGRQCVSLLTQSLHANHQRVLVNIYKSRTFMSVSPRGTWLEFR